MNFACGEKIPTIFLREMEAAEFYIQNLMTQTYAATTDKTKKFYVTLDLQTIYSGASAREARQRSTMGKKNW